MALYNLFIQMYTLLLKDNIQYREEFFFTSSLFLLIFLFLIIKFYIVSAITNFWTLYEEFLSVLMFITGVTVHIRTPSPAALRGSLLRISFPSSISRFYFQFLGPLCRSKNLLCHPLPAPSPLSPFFLGEDSDSGIPSTPVIFYNAFPLWCLIGLLKAFRTVFGSFSQCQFRSLQNPVSPDHQQRPLIPISIKYHYYPLVLKFNYRTAINPINPLNRYPLNTLVLVHLAFKLSRPSIFRLDPTRYVKWSLEGQKVCKTCEEYGWVCKTCEEREWGA